MSRVKFISDHELKHKGDILTILQAYNTSKTGERKKDTYFIYAFQGKELVGGLCTEQFWDWAFINKLYYKDFDVLKALLNQMYTYYKDSIVGIQYASNDDIVTKHVLECGFEISGQLPNYPKGKTKRDFVNTQLKQIQVTSKYDLIVSNEKNLEHEAKLDNLIPKAQNKQIDLQFVALDDQTVAGGVYGYIKNGYLYVSLLVVSDDYRGQRIASQLMDLIEKESHDRGYDDMYLDTCEFQALGFYLKRDYKKIATIKQFPKGFDEYTLAKKYI